MEATSPADEPDDRAGSYAIQGIGGLFVTRVEGSPSNVVGLPVRLLYTLAAERWGWTWARGDERDEDSLRRVSGAGAALGGATHRRACRARFTF